VAQRSAELPRNKMGADVRTRPAPGELRRTTQAVSTGSSGWFFSSVFAALPLQRRRWTLGEVVYGQTTEYLTIKERAESLKLT